MRAPSPASAHPPASAWRRFRCPSGQNGKEKERQSGERRKGGRRGSGKKGREGARTALTWVVCAWHQAALVQREHLALALLLLVGLLQVAHPVDQLRLVHGLDVPPRALDALLVGPPRLGQHARRLGHRVVLGKPGGLRATRVCVWGTCICWATPRRGRSHPTATGRGCSSFGEVLGGRGMCPATHDSSRVVRWREA